MAHPVRFFRLFLDVVTGTGPARGSHGSADDCAGRSGDCAADQRTGGRPTERPGPGARFVVAFSRFPRDRTRHGTDPASDDGAHGPTHGHADGGATQGTRAGADSFRAAFLVFGGRAVIPHPRVVVRVIVSGHLVVIVIH